MAGETPGDEIREALYAEAGKFWEMARVTMQIYVADTGATVPVMPPWGELSEESKDVVYDFVGTTVGEFVMVAGLTIPEVDTSVLD